MEAEKKEKKEVEEKMTYKPTTARWKGRTKTLYVVYEETHIHNYRGHRKPRTQTRVKRVYVSGRNIKVSKVGTYKNRRGRRVHGIKITYKNPIKGGAGRGHKIKEMTVTKIVPLPKSARKVRVKRSSKGIRKPLMDIT